MPGIDMRLQFFPLLFGTRSLSLEFWHPGLHRSMPCFHSDIVGGAVGPRAPHAQAGVRSDQ